MRTSHSPILLERFYAMSFQSNYDIIITSQDLEVRVSQARADAMARKRYNAAELLRKIPDEQYWTYPHPENLNALAEGLAKALIVMVEDASVEEGIDLLIQGIEQKMSTPPQFSDTASAVNIIRYRIERFERGKAWLYSSNAESGLANDERTTDYDADAIKDFGAAVASLSWSRDYREASLGFPYMVATIAYLLALDPAQDLIGQ